MADNEETAFRELVKKGYAPDGRNVRGGYIPETSEAGPPPRGGSGSTGGKGGSDDQKG